MNITEHVLKLTDSTNIGDCPLEKSIGIARGSLLHWRKEKAKPSIEALCKIADYFTVSVDELLGRDVSKNKNNIILPNIPKTELELLIEKMNDYQVTLLTAYAKGLLAETTLEPV